MHSVLEMHAFERSAKELGMSDDERHRIIKFLSENPEAGDLIQGTGGARKIRFPFKGKGKRGGVRVVTYFAAEDIPVFLLDVFAKGERINMTKAERNQLRDILSDVAEDYRASTKEKLAVLTRSKA